MVTTETQMMAAGVEGVSRLYEWGGIVTLLMLVVMALMAFCVYLMRRNNELAEKFMAALLESTKAIIEFKEALRDVSKR